MRFEAATVCEPPLDASTATELARHYHRLRVPRRAPVVASARLLQILALHVIYRVGITEVASTMSCDLCVPCEP